jgi:hypothetical protein
MKESVSRPGSQGLQSQPHNGQPGAGTPAGHLVEEGTQEVGPADVEVLRKHLQVLGQYRWTWADLTGSLTCLHVSSSLALSKAE